MVDHFTKEQFEAALPRVDGVSAWTYAGQIQGEHCYLVPVRNLHGHCVAVMVRSSVHESGHSAGTGEDSIRCWLVNPEDHSPMSGKLSKYVTRVPGWEKRMLGTIRELYRLGMKLRPCPVCGCMMSLGKVKKDGPNKGRMFQSCRTQDKMRAHGFDWVTDRALVPASALVVPNPRPAAHGPVLQR